MKTKRQVSIGKRIMYTNILLVISVSLVLTALSYNSARNSIFDITLSNFQERTKDNVRAIEKEFEFKKSQLEYISKLPEIQSMDWEIQKPTLVDQTKKMNFDSIFIVDANGFGYYPAKTEILDQSKEEFFLTMKEKGSFITEPYIRQEEKESVTTIVIPIKNDSDSTLGYLCGTIKLDEINSIVQSVKIGEDGYAFLTNETGKFAAHKNMDLVFNEINLLDYFNEKKDDGINTELNSLLDNV